jgi:nucleotide-binding universal stress UspA family protein
MREIETPVLVFGDDGSQGADVAWLWVNEQPWPGWRIEVVSVTPATGVRPPTEEDAALKPWLPPAPRDYFRDDAAEVVHLTATADPRAVLGRRGDAGLVVIGPRGRGFFKALRLGSVAEWLLQCPPAPLLIARSGKPMRRILVCIDGSPHAWRAAQVGAALPLVAGTEVTVLTVGYVGSAAPDDVAAAADLYATAGAAVDVVEMTPDPLELFYNVRDTVLDIAAERDVDLVVMGTRGNSQWQTLRIGSTASAVTRYARASMLLAHA